MEYRKLEQEEFYRKSTNETVYLFNEFEDAVLRHEPNGDVYVKLKGKVEFKGKDGSTLIADTYLDALEISKKDYDSY